MLLLHTASQKGSGPAGWVAPLPSPCGLVCWGASLLWVQRSCSTSARTRGWDPPLGVQADAPSAAPCSVASSLSQNVGQPSGRNGTRELRCEERNPGPHALRYFLSSSPNTLSVAETPFSAPHSQSARPWRADLSLEAK